MVTDFSAAEKIEVHES